MYTSIFVICFGIRFSVKAFQYTQYGIMMANFPNMLIIMVLVFKEPYNSFLKIPSLR